MYLRAVYQDEIPYIDLVYLFIQEEIEIKKDTERADEIRALKKAWEDAEPGRAAKVLYQFIVFVECALNIVCVF